MQIKFVCKSSRKPCQSTSPSSNRFNKLRLSERLSYDRSCDALASFSRREPSIYLPKVTFVDDGVVFLYEGDAGYDVADPATEGERHRFLMMNSGWDYEKSF